MLNRQRLSFDQFEKGFARTVFNPVVRVKPIAITKVYVRSLDLEERGCARLRTQGKVHQTTFLDNLRLRRVLRVHSDLVAEQRNELAREPVLDVLIRLAEVFSLALVELDCELLGLLRVLVAPDDQISVVVNALEFGLPSFNLIHGCYLNRVSFRLCARLQAQFFLRASVMGQAFRLSTDATDAVLPAVVLEDKLAVLTIIDHLLFFATSTAILDQRCGDEKAVLHREAVLRRVGALDHTRDHLGLSSYSQQEQNLQIHIDARQCEHASGQKRAKAAPIPVTVLETKLQAGRSLAESVQLPEPRGQSPLLLARKGAFHGSFATLDALI